MTLAEARRILAEPPSPPHKGMMSEADALFYDDEAAERAQAQRIVARAEARGAKAAAPEVPAVDGPATAG